MIVEKNIEFSESINEIIRNYSSSDFSDYLENDIIWEIK